ncbi:activator of 90 kDa heat shock protein ATPase homolog 1 [Episyrphus balteatus]|uniref:activator of 90 kDa heat shock protein ATPase homolog 1 n=1 Tax=Episyrphus balteatus TaxID=286459 RepID=UPI002485B0B5|nr:activator of 90 kDa heat shock protein ATPase homolog 1 [Episyrphus balteatus]
MAKWGEGDPRWIVEERPDATNVNNWHWTEKNATLWSKERLKSLFSDLKIDQGGTQVIIDKIEDCTGEATANNRKGKLIFFYEWNIVLKWSGRLPGAKEKYSGKANIPNLSEEYNINEIEITITIDESNNEDADRLKQYMYNVGREVIRKQLGTYIKELKEEYSKGLILPRKGCEDVTSPNSGGQPKKSAFNNSNSSAQKTISPTSNKNEESNSSVGYKLDVKTLTMSEDFQCSAFDLYNALTKPEMVTAFTRGQVKIEPVRGGEFALFGGNIQGKFEELVPEKKISQSWRLKSWPSGHYSNVTIDLEQMRDHTQLTLKQSGIPSAEYETTETNWRRYYWHSIRQTFGFGPMLRNGL